MARVLISGSAGFIGSHLVDHCLAEGHEVIALDNLTGGNNSHPKVMFYPLDIRNGPAIYKLFRDHRITHVIHAAAYAAEGLSPFVAGFNYDNNVTGSMNVINAAIESEVQRFVFLSSIAVYGSTQVPMTEDLLPQPEDPYGLGKAAVEGHLKCCEKVFGLPYTIFRPHNVYGERQNVLDPYRNVVGIFMAQCKRGEPLTVYGDGTQQRAFTYIDDVAPAIVKSLNEMKCKNEIINIGTDEVHTVNGLATMVAAAMGVKAKIKNITARHEVHTAYSDHAKAIELFGKPKTKLEDGLKKMAVWVNNNWSKFHKTKQPTIEVSKHLPPSWK